MNATTRSRFKECLEYLMNFKTNNPNYKKKFVKLSKKIPSYQLDSAKVKNFIQIFDSLEDRSRPILHVFADIDTENREEIDIIKLLIRRVENFREGFSRISSKTNNLTLVPYLLSDIYQTLVNINERMNVSAAFVFNYEYDADVEAENELRKYVARGEIINSDPGYSHSPIGQLERFVQDKVRSIRNYIGNNNLRNQQDEFQNIFYAIVAPSMAGKTQAAFTFKNVRCLYFLMTDFSRGAYGDIQVIYRNFFQLSTMFQEFAAADVERLEKILNASFNLSSNVLEHISATELLLLHSRTKFKTLGFIAALINHANSNFNPSNHKWMSFYATTSKNIVVEEMCLADFKNFNFGNYALFFDEFESHNWSAFVRNLFRAAMFPIFVANTNSNAANLVGKLTSSQSRTRSKNGWSLVTIILNSINRNILNKMYPALQRKIISIMNSAINQSEKTFIRVFFEDFFNNHLQNLRPGFADVIASKIMELPNLLGISLNRILTIIIASLADEIKDKKSAVHLKLEGVLGSLALFMNNAYLPSDVSLSVLAKKISHMKSYLQHHFYYLINPVDVTKWCFLTYRPDATDNPLKVFIRTPQGQKFIDWKIEYTFFMSEEILPFLAFQSIISSKYSIPYALTTGLELSEADARTTGRTPNYSQNVPLNGDELEVISTVSLIDASQHFVGFEKSSFCGQNGKSFLTNLIGNLIKAPGYRRENKVNFDDSLARNFLSGMHIPFLFPAGMDLPPIFLTYFANNEGFNGRSLNFGKFGRTINSMEIDAIFNYFIKNGVGVVPFTGICSVECKNWRRNLQSAHLLKILDKAKLNHATFSLIICNSLGNPEPVTQVNFYSECLKNSWNVLKLQKVDSGPGSKKFKLIKYIPDFELINTPEMTCIILELRVINSKF